MKIQTAKFKNMLGQLINVAGFNNLLPITSMIGIKTQNNKLILSTTDTVTSMSLSVDMDDVDDLNICVDAQKLFKLVSKFTAEITDLKINDNVLTVTGNGAYKIPITVDEEGIVQFPEVAKISAENDISISKNIFTSIYSENKTSVAKTFEVPCLTGYYINDTQAITTDGTVLTFNNAGITDIDNSMLLPSKLIQILATVNYTNINLHRENSKLCFYGPDIIITSSVLPDIDTYPIKEVTALKDVKFDGECTISKSALLTILDRLILFIEPYDKNGVYLNFQSVHISLQSRKDTAVEILKYTENINHTDFKCFVDIVLLKEQLSGISDDIITMQYGYENAIKIISKDGIHIMSLLDDTNM